jgi:hypothetical protein
MAQISPQATTVGTLMCMAAIFSQLSKRGLVTIPELEEALQGFSAILTKEAESPTKMLQPGTPADVLTYLGTFLEILKSKPVADDPKPKHQTPEWFRGVVDGGKPDDAKSD